MLQNMEPNKLTKMATGWIYIWQNVDNTEFTNIWDKPNFAAIGKSVILNVAKTGKKQVYQNVPKLAVKHTCSIDRLVMINKLVAIDRVVAIDSIDKLVAIDRVVAIDSIDKLVAIDRLDRIDGLVALHSTYTMFKAHLKHQYLSISIQLTLPCSI